MTGAKLPERLPQHVFADRLESLRTDPHGSVIEMSLRMDVSLSQRLGFTPYLAEHHSRTFREKPLTVVQFEAIQSLGEMVVLLSKHGTYVPRALGHWLKTPNKELDEKSPLDIVFEDFRDGEFYFDDVKRVIRVADNILPPPIQGEEAIRVLLNR